MMGAQSFWNLCGGGMVSIREGSCVSGKERLRPVLPMGFGLCDGDTLKRKKTSNDYSKEYV